MKPPMSAQPRLAAEKEQRRREREEEMEGRNYAIIKPCGCLSAVALLLPNDKKMASVISRLMARGENVQQVTNEFVRQSKWGCEECKPKMEAP